MADEDNPPIDGAKAFRRLSPRTKRFVMEFCRGCNQSVALREAGFTGARADIAASKLMARPEVRAAVDWRMEQIVQEAGIEAVHILRELALIAFDRAHKDRLKALELLGKNLKMFTDKIEVQGKLTLEALVERSLGAIP